MKNLLNSIPKRHNNNTIPNVWTYFIFKISRIVLVYVVVEKIGEAIATEQDRTIERENLKRGSARELFETLKRFV